MAGKNKLKYYVSADTSDFKRKMREVGDATKTVSKGLGVGIAGGAAVATAGVFALNQVMSEAIELAKVQEQAEAKLASVLRATGEAAGYNLEELRDMAGEMQNLTTVGDEVILSNMAVLATFKNVRKEGFERATKAALDMSTVMDQDLKSSMVQIGKALNDPTQGLSSLTRIGVTFTDQQKDMIKTLQDSGDIMGAQAIILEELESQFGGAAESLRDNFGGAVTAMGNAFGDLQEQIGFSITKNEFFIKSANILEDTFVELTGDVADNQEAMNALAKSVGLGLVGAIQGAIKVVGFFHTGWLTLKTAVPVVVDAFQFGVDAIYKILRGLMLPLDAIFEGIEKIAGFLGKDFVNPFDTIQLALNDFGAMTQTVMEQNFEDIATTKAAYDALGGKIDEIKGKLQQVGTASVDNAQKISTSTIGFGATDDGEYKTAIDKNADYYKQKALEIVDFDEAIAEAKEERLEKEFEEAGKEFVKAYNERKTKQEKFEEEFQKVSQQSTNAIVNAFVSGEDAKVAAAGVAKDYLSQYAVDAATQGLQPIFEALGAQIGAWVGLGTAEESTEGTGWKEKLANAAKYLAGAGTAIYAGKAIGDEVFASGGWLGSNPGGGMITHGSGVRDDVFLGYTDNGSTRNWGMRGEMVMNKRATAKFFPILDAWNKGYEEGGPIVDAWGPTERINDSGFDAFWKSVIKTKGNWKKAIGETIAYYAGTGLGMLGGKELGPEIFFNKGGLVRDRGFLFGGFLDDLMDPLGIDDEINDVLDYMIDPGVAAYSWYRDKYGEINFGTIWDKMRDLPIIDDTIKRADKILYPFVRDVLTPGKNVTWDTFEDMLSATYEGLSDELATWLTVGGVDPLLGTVGALGSLSGGSRYIQKEGLHYLHEGESVNTRAETQRNDPITIHIKGNLSAAIEEIIVERNRQNVPAEVRVYT